MFHPPHDTQIVIFPAREFRTQHNSLPAALNFIRGKTLLEHQIIEFYKCGFRNFLLFLDFESEIFSQILGQLSQRFKNLEIHIVKSTSELKPNHFYSKNSDTYLIKSLIVPDNTILQFLCSEIEKYFDSPPASKLIRFNQINSDSNVRQGEIKEIRTNPVEPLALLLSSDLMRKLLQGGLNPADILLSSDKSLENIPLTLQGYVFMSNHYNSKLENYLDNT